MNFPTSPESLKQTWQVRNDLPPQHRVRLIMLFLMIAAKNSGSTYSLPSLFASSMSLSSEVQIPPAILEQGKKLFTFKSLFEFILETSKATPNYLSMVLAFHTNHIVFLVDAIVKQSPCLKELCIPSFNPIESLMLLVDLGFRAGIGTFQESTDIFSENGPLLTAYIQMSFFSPLAACLKDPLKKSHISPIRDDFEQRYKKFLKTEHVFAMIGRHWNSILPGLDSADTIDLTEFGPAFESRFNGSISPETLVHDNTFPIPFQKFSTFKFSQSLEDQIRYGKYILKNLRVTQMNKVQRCLAAIAAAYKPTVSKSADILQKMFLQTIYEVSGFTQLAIDTTVENLKNILEIQDELVSSAPEAQKMKPLLSTVVSLSYIRLHFLRHQEGAFDKKVLDVSSYGDLKVPIRQSLESLENITQDLATNLQTVCKAFNYSDQEFVNILSSQPDFQKVAEKYQSKLGVALPKIVSSSSSTSSFNSYIRIFGYLTGAAVLAAGIFYSPFLSFFTSKSPQSSKPSSSNVEQKVTPQA